MYTRIGHLIPAYVLRQGQTGSTPNQWWSCLSPAPSSIHYNLPTERLAPGLWSGRKYRLFTAAGLLRCPRPFKEWLPQAIARLLGRGLPMASTMTIVQRPIPRVADPFTAQAVWTPTSSYAPDRTGLRLSRPCTSLGS